MAGVGIYYNPGRSKSRRALVLLGEQGVQAGIVECLQVLPDQVLGML